MSSNFIKILPNIYLCDTMNLNIGYLQMNSITNIITTDMNINMEIEEIGIKQINIPISPTNINLEQINNLLISILKKSNNILIISNQNIIGFIIVSSFMIKYLSVSFFQILLLDKYYSINIKRSKYYQILQIYYKSNSSN